MKRLYLLYWCKTKIYSNLNITVRLSSPSLLRRKLENLINQSIRKPDFITIVKKNTILAKLKIKNWQHSPLSDNFFYSKVIFPSLEKFFYYDGRIFLQKFFFQNILNESCSSFNTNWVSNADSKLCTLSCNHN